MTKKTVLVEEFIYDRDAEKVRRWLSARHKEKEKDFILPPKGSLPSCGFIVNDLACGFLYTTNSNLGWLEWVISNPERPKEEREEAIDLIFHAIADIAGKLDIKILITASAFEGYSKIATRNGFNATDRGITHFIKIIPEGE